MTRLLIIISILTINCSTEKKETNDKTFADLSQDEKLKAFGQLSKELNGDFLVFTGQAIFEDTTGNKFADSTTLVQLVMDKDYKFAIRTKFVEKKVETDTMTFHFQGGQSNKGIGKWTDLGDKFELKFELGTVDSFLDNENNREKVKTIDNYTFQFDKSVDELWIWQTPCKKLGD
jgi:hypothetical protein